MGARENSPALNTVSAKGASWKITLDANDNFAQISLYLDGAATGQEVDLKLTAAEYNKLEDLANDNNIQTSPNPNPPIA